jgi:hypothetical protein
MKKLLTLMYLALFAVCVAAGQTVKAVTISPATVAGGNSATGTVTLSKKAGTQGTVVSLSSATSAAVVPGSVTVSGGALKATFTVTTKAVAATTKATIAANAGTGSAKASLTIQPPKLTSLTFNPSSVLGGASTTGTLQIGSPAPADGLNIALSCTSKAWAGPASVTVSGGAKSATFTCATKPVAVAATALVTAKLGTSTVSRSLTIKAPSLNGLTLNPAAIGGGATSTGTVSLTGPAPAAGLKIALKSNKTLAKVPSAVTVSGGATSATFIISTSAVTAQASVKISATQGETT